MKIGVIGAGRIGGNAARLFAAEGHDVLLSFSRDPDRLAEQAAAIGAQATVGTARDAAQFGDVVMLSVPWTAIPDALGQAGPLEGKIVIDTTNQFGPGGVQQVPGGLTAAQYNQQRMPGSRLVKSFNTLTSGFQASAAGRPVPEEQVVLFLCGDDERAKAVVSGLIEDGGFVPVDLGGLADAGPMEAPRRPGAVYGEEYRTADGQAVADALRAGRPIPAAPAYAPPAR
jgi:8-hydroxy-5-deazaflavin:NADPH oxidoreductase